MKNILFTKEGYKSLRTKYDNLLEERKEAVKTLAQARELGDLSENGLYKGARARLSSIDNHLRRFKERLNLGEIVNSPLPGVIGIESRVKLICGNKVLEYMIVGEYEADPFEGKISYISPLGRELINKKTGSTVTVNAPNGEIICKIMSIKP